MNQTNSAKSRRFKFGALATVFTVVFVVAVIIFNIIATALQDRFPLEIDLTPKAVYSMSDEAEKFIKSVDQEVTITIIGQEATFATGSYSVQDIMPSEPMDHYFVSINQILKTLPKLNPKIKVQYVDKTENPSFFQNYTESLKEGMIIVDCPSRNRHRILTAFNYLTIIDDLNNPNYSTFVQQGFYVRKVTGSNLENAICSSLMTVSAEKLPVISFVNGHNENAVSAYQAMLNQNGFELKTTNIVTEDLDENTEFLVIAGPERDFSEADLNKLDDYLAKGKNLMVFLNPGVGRLPNLEAFLQEWGIGVGDGMICESDSANAYRYPYFVVSRYADNTYTTGLNAPAVVPMGRPLNILWDEKEDIEVSSVLKTYGSAVICPSDAPSNWTVEDATEKGEFNSIIKSTKLTSSTEEGRTYSNVFVCNSLYFVYDDKDPLNFLSNPVFGNAELSLNIVTKSTDRQNLNLITKVINPEELTMMLSTANNVGIVFMAVVPVLVLAAGLGVWFRRKRL